MTIRPRAVALGLGVAALLLVAGYMVRRGAEPEAPVHAPDPVASKPRPNLDRGSWQAKLDQIQAARSRRIAAGHRATTGPPASDRCDQECWGTLGMQVELASLAEGCRELLGPDAVGTARFEATVIAEPDVGAAIESVQIVEDPLQSPAFTECIVESAPALHLASPDGPVSDVFAFRYSAGKRPDNAADFLAARPDIIEKYPQLRPLVGRAAGERVTSEHATTFARVIADNDDARTAFSDWVADQGIDLSQVRVGD